MSRRYGKTIVAVCDFMQKTRGMRDCTIYIRERHYPIFLREIPECYVKELGKRNVKVETINV